MTTPILELDEWEEAQASPHVTINEALRWLECFAALIVLDKDLTEPPASPSDGDRYIVAADATSDWADQDNKIAMYIGNAWAFKEAPDGTRAHVLDEGDDYRYSATSSPPGWSIIS